MTARPPAQCASCRHWLPAIDTDSDEQTCDAFPAGIPDDIWWNRADHRKAFPGDNGVRWESDGKAAFPEWALVRKQ